MTFEYAPHYILEALAYFIGGQIYWRQRKKYPSTLSKLDHWQLIVAAIFGAILGSKTLHILEHLHYFETQPWIAFLQGKSVLGGFLGGTLGVELMKKAMHIRQRTGDIWVFPLLFGLMIGRLGCQFSGIWDQTYGIPTSLPWGWNYGDDISRHPTGIYEIILLAILGIILSHINFKQVGQQFSAFLLGYCVIRFCVEFLKPPFGLDANTTPVDLYGFFTAIQWAAIWGGGYFTWRLCACSSQKNDEIRHDNVDV